MPDALRIVFLPYVLSRAVLGLVAGLTYLGVRFARPGDPQHAWPLQPWLSWDAVHYLRIAREGYPTTVHSADGGFFPLLPLLLKLVGGSDAAAIVLSFGLGLAGLAVLAALTARVLDREAAVRVAWIAAFWPAALFWSAVYTEGLFLALAAGALWAAWRGQVPAAALLGLAAGLLRPNGLMLAVPLLVLLPAGRSRLAAVTPVLGAAAFAVYMWLHTGDPHAFLGSQTANHPMAVGRPFALLLTRDPMELAGLAFLLVAVLATWRLWQGGPKLGVWRVAGPVTVAALLLPSLATGSLGSFGRYTMAAFPVYWYVQRLPAPLLLVIGIPAVLAYTALSATGRLTP